MVRSSCTLKSEFLPSNWKVPAGDGPCCRTSESESWKPDLTESNVNRVKPEQNTGLRPPFHVRQSIGRQVFRRPGTTATQPNAAGDRLRGGA